MAIPLGGPPPVLVYKLLGLQQAVLPEEKVLESAWGRLPSRGARLPLHFLGCTVRSALEVSVVDSLPCQPCPRKLLACVLV